MTLGSVPAVIVSLLLLSSTALWTVAAAVGLPGYTEVAVVLIALSAWTCAVAATAGMIVARSRWARRLTLVLSAGHLIMAVVRPIDGWWLGAVAATAATAVGAAGPWLAGHVRSLPSATGPPGQAVMVPLLLTGAPWALGLAGAAGSAPLVVGLAALATAFWFARALPGALVAVRGVWPLLAAALAPSMGLQVGAVSAGLALAVAATAWHPGVARAVHPLVERGAAVAIPPELAPPEVLDAAGLDDRGRRR